MSTQVATSHAAGALGLGYRRICGILHAPLDDKCPTCQTFDTCRVGSVARWIEFEGIEPPQEFAPPLYWLHPETGAMFIAEYVGEKWQLTYRGVRDVLVREASLEELRTLVRQWLGEELYVEPS
jgi:hypothetical protein